MSPAKRILPNGARPACLALALTIASSCNSGQFGPAGAPYGRNPRDGAAMLGPPEVTPPALPPGEDAPPPPPPMPDAAPPDEPADVPETAPPPPRDAPPEVAPPPRDAPPEVAPPPRDASPPPPEAAPPPKPTDIPPDVEAVLRSRCFQCHTFGQRDPIGWGSTLDINRLIAADIVVPGDLARSRLWQRVAVKADMPFDNGPRIQGADLLALKNWIETLQRPTPTPRTQEQILDIVVLDQNGAGNRNPNFRYLSFAHFVDERRSAAEMREIEGVLNLTLNSLSRNATLYKVEAINYERSVFRIDLGRLGWNADLWNRVVSFYPYCVQSTKQAHRDLYTRLRTEAPVVRGDWFMATAHKAPLYEELTDIKQTLDEQAAVLGVDINANLQSAQNVIRMGFKSSGVSLHNRVIERHGRANGAYLWVSYDFERDGIGDTNDILENPLGPKLRDRDNFAHDFVNAAGEIIFSLPNGMQAFMLVNDVGQRVNVAATTIVADQRRRDGAVQNGISCFGCHGITGMLRPRVFDEVIRNAEANRNKYSAQEFDRIRRLYVRNGDAILATDAARYFRSVDALGTNRTLGGGIEYDTYIALIGEYEARLGLRGSALEVGVDALTLTNLVRGRPELTVPVSAANPLVTRDEFVCRYRRIVKALNNNANFCANTFSDASLQTFCDNR